MKAGRHHANPLYCSQSPNCNTNLAKCTCIPEAKMLMKKGRHRQTDGLVDLRGFLATSTPLHLSRRFVSLSLSPRLHPSISSVACPLSTCHGPLNAMVRAATTSSHRLCTRSVVHMMSMAVSRLSSPAWRYPSASANNLFMWLNR
jgi:hypothetical protein